MTEFQQAIEFIERVEAVTSLDDLRLALTDTLENFGVPNFSMIGMIAAHEGAPRVATPLVRRADEGWVDHYWDKKRFNIDPIIHTALQRYTAFSWKPFEHSRQSKEVRDLFAEIREAMPIDGGLAIPTHDEDGFAGLLALFHEGGELTGEQRRALKLISVYAIERAKELYALDGVVEQAMGAGCPLTPRQREVVSWVALGKSDWDISSILGIAQSTVNEHMEAAKKALGVKSRAQAVAVAVRRGWITI